MAMGGRNGVRLQDIMYPIQARLQLGLWVLFGQLPMPDGSRQGVALERNLAMLAGSPPPPSLSSVPHPRSSPPSPSEAGSLVTSAKSLATSALFLAPGKKGRRQYLYYYIVLPCTSFRG